MALELISLLFNSLDEFKDFFYSHRVPLSDIVIKPTKNSLNPESIDDDIIPNKFNIELIRFWRRKELLPFFEEGKHPRISIAQLLWLRFLQSLRNFGCDISLMQKAHQYFIKRAYDDNLALRNLIMQKDVFLSEIEQQSSTKQDIIEIQARISLIDSIMSDPALIHSLRMDINYFTYLIMNYLVNDNNASIVINDQGEIAELLDNNLVQLTHGGYKPVVSIDIEKPHIRLPIKSFLADFFNDGILSENAINVFTLNDDERKIISYIRDKKVSEVNIKLRNGKINRYDISKESVNSLSLESIANIKKSLGLKDYEEINLAMIDGKSILIKRKKKHIIKK